MGIRCVGLSDLFTAKLGQVNNVVRSQKTFGERTRTSDFFGATLWSASGSKMTLTGNVDTGRIVEDDCYVVDSPQQLLNCHLVSSFKAETVVKVNGSYKFPRDVTASAVFQNIPGVTYGAGTTATKRGNCAFARA